ncbi:MAG: M64 family metallopeptidase [Flavobacteriaceae bacterium]|nr:M64 family metallopeptidase [Flavobacteriaceae bacterium]
MKQLCLILFLMNHFSYGQQFEVVEIERNGPLDRSINYVIMGDGFTENEQDLFLEKARGVTEYILNKPPYSNYRRFFNVYAIEVISNESGANHPGTGEVDTEDYLSSTHPVKEVDNYFGSSFDSYGIHRLLVPNNYNRIYDVLTTNFPAFDQGLILVNTPFYGGSGGAFATCSLDDNATAIMFHEIGHSFTDLIDEYYAGDQYAREGINMTQETNPNSVRWKNWIGVTEIIDADGSPSPIGIYQHGQGDVSSEWFKPSTNKCLMEILYQPLCEVCREGTVERIHDLVFDFPDLFEDTSSVSILSTSSTLTVSVDQRVQDVFETNWYHNNRLIRNGGLTYVMTDSLQMESGDHIKVVLSDNNPSFLRVNGHQDIHNKTFSWIYDIDTDGDGVFNLDDTDDDNDGVIDVEDDFPLNSSENTDSDNDGVGDNTDAFPLDSTESVDTDSDGIGNNADTDDDNDGVEDSSDQFPLDSTESVDTDSDGIGNNADTDDDNDGINDLDDLCENTPLNIIVDIRGCKVFNLPENNYKIEMTSSSCNEENDGSISISVEDEGLNYTLRIDGENSLNLNSTDGYQQTLSNLSPGVYQLCFTVEGESGYNQCFDINITEPPPLSASSKVNKSGKSMSFSLDGSDRYTIVHNGVERVFDISNPEIELKKGVNFIEVKTDKLCQGTYTEEVFISEKVEFYPNPTSDVVNLYIHGKDKTVDLKIVGRDGNIIGTSCRDIQSNRKVRVNLEQYPKGVYLIQTKGETVQKTIKIIRE